MNIIDNAVRMVCGSNEDLDPNSREFMLKAFEDTPYIEELYSTKSTEERISDFIMENSAAYTQILQELVERMNNERDAN